MGDLDLAWHIQMALINQYKKILSRDDDADGRDEGEDMDRIGTTDVRLDDVFGIGNDSMNRMLKSQQESQSGYRRMSLPRDYEQMVDLTKIDVDEMDEKLVEHLVKYLKREKGASVNDKDGLKEMIKERKNKKQKLKVPW